MESKNLTIVFTDMKGFTRRSSQESRAGVLQLINRLRELLLPVLTDHGGQLIKTIGDGFLLTFESPTNAVLACVALQQILRQNNAQSEKEERIEIRIAVNTGEVSLENGDIFGEAVNVAARVQALAQPNQIYLTEATYLSMNRSEVQTVSIGKRTLKGIPHPVRVFRVVSQSEGLVRWLPSKKILGIAGVSVVVLLIIFLAVSMNASFQEEQARLEREEEIAMIIEAIQNERQVFQERVELLQSEITGVEPIIIEQQNQMDEIRTNLSEMNEQINQSLALLPNERQANETAFNQRIEEAIQRDDSYTVGHLSASLEQYAGEILKWEEDARNAQAELEKILVTLDEASARSQGRRQIISVLTSDLDQQLLAINEIEPQEGWETIIEQKYQTLEETGHQIGLLHEMAVSLQEDIEMSHQRTSSTNELVNSWHDLQDQWRTRLEAP